VAGGRKGGFANQVAMVVARVSTHHYYACYTHIQGDVGT